MYKNIPLFSAIFALFLISNSINAQDNKLGILSVNKP